MDINELITIVKKKLEKEISIENISVEDKSFLHKKHANYEKEKFHLKILISSNQLKEMAKLESNRLIHKILSKELDKFIHSIQILIK